MSASPHLAKLFRYPLKGFSPEALSSIELKAGENVPFDRIYAIENGPGRFDPNAPKHLPKITFLMLMRDERVASIQATFDTTTHQLTLRRDGRVLASGNLGTSDGRAAIEAFIADDFKSELRGAPKIVSSPGHVFTDVAAKCVHIVNLASVHDLSQRLARDVDPVRFRANLFVDGLAPFDEFKWLDKTITFKNGVTLTVLDRTVRCAATEVNPQTATRDISMLRVLRDAYGHNDFGIYAKVATGGRLTPGETFSVA
jgi:uncharacterized protein